YGVKSFSYELDVRNYDEFEKFVDKTVDEFGSLDILVNIAGIGTMMPLTVMPVDLINAIIDIDLKGTVYGCKAAFKYMIPQKSGKIVNTSSIAAKACTENSSCYAAAKAGVISLTAALAREVAQHDINVNAVLPGIVRTNMWESQLQMVAGDDEEKKKEVFASFTKGIPLARPQETIDIANTILFLCTDEACNITAQHVAIDGGYTC
ncbi:MAG: SDR family oxidoreductase, partial [Clostridium sp.]|nr:SDR family oxidoreductase [Clostridium sp.]